MIRQPAVAGQFYSRTPEVLAAEVARHMAPSIVPRQARAIISPHAGLMYSGSVAGAVYSRIILPRTVILIGPNHTGFGPAVSVYPEGAWLIPGGELSVDREFTSEILARYPTAQADTSAHRFEHCLEVQLPFLWHMRSRTSDPPPLTIVPVVLRTTRDDILRELGLRLADIIEALSRTTRSDAATGPLLIASTDMNHYESDRRTREKDQLAIEAIQALNPEGLTAVVRSQGISMCGVGPTAAVLHTACRLGATGASLIRYATSGEVSGDFDRVVGYAGFVIP